jgi:hypothetical protein
MGKSSDPAGGIFGGERLHGKSANPSILASLTFQTDIIRQYQAHHLYDNYKLTELHVFRDTISKSFEHQVLAT